MHFFSVLLSKQVRADGVRGAPPRSGGLSEMSRPRALLGGQLQPAPRRPPGSPEKRRLATAPEGSRGAAHSGGRAQKRREAEEEDGRVWRHFHVSLVRASEAVSEAHSTRALRRSTFRRSLAAFQGRGHTDPPRHGSCLRGFGLPDFSSHGRGSSARPWLGR